MIISGYDGVHPGSVYFRGPILPVLRTTPQYFREHGSHAGNGGNSLQYVQVGEN